MARYEITAPDGSRYEVTAPDDATEDQVMQFAQSQWKSSEPKPQPKPEPQDKPISKLGLTHQGMQGLTFGTSDEIVSGMAAPFAAFANPTGSDKGYFDRVKDAYSDIHQSLQDERNQFKAENPKAALAAELVGGLATGGLGASKVMASQAVTKASPLARALALSATGAAEGGAYGYASGDRGKRGESASFGAITGAVGAPLLNVAGRVTGKVVEPAFNRIKASMKSPQKEGVQYLADVLSREGVKSLDDLASLDRGGNAMLADLSYGGRGALEGIVQHIENPSIRKMAAESFQKRNAGQPSRIFENVRAKFGIDPEMTAKDAVKNVGERRQARAAPLYQQAENKRIVMTDNIKAHLHPTLGTEEVIKAYNIAERRMWTRQNAGERVTQFTIVDEMKKQMDDQIETLWRSGAKRRAGDLIKIKNSILKDIDDQNPAYKKAREIWAGESALIDATEKGKNILREDVDYLDDLVAAMSESEKEMFRLGAMKAIREKLMLAREGTNSVNRIASELNLDRMRRAFPTDEAFREFKKDLQFEASIFDTSRVLHNSMTALRQAVQKDMEKGGSGTLREGASTVQDILSHSAGAIGGALDALLGRGVSIEAKEEMGKVLLTPLKDLPPNVWKMLDNEITKTLPLEKRGPASRLIQGSISALKRSDVSIPAIAPSVMDQE